MKVIAVSLSVVAGLMIATQSTAAEMPPLAKAKGCAACHAIERKMTGPAWNDVAKKYRADKGAEAKLVAKIKKGGSGVWGSVAMPPQMVKDDEAKQLVKFILALGK